LTPEAIIVAFREVNDLIIRLMEDARGLDYKETIVETKIRLEQAIVLLIRFRDAELRIVNTHDDVSQQVFDVRLYGEAFYYFGWKVKTCLDVLHRLNPEIDLRVKARGINTVRNRMIEHPEKTDGVYVSMWATRRPEGLVLHAADDGSDTLDRGLYPNAEELATELLTKLRKQFVDNGGAA